MDQIKTLGPKRVKIVLIGNKSDLSEERVISFEEGKALAESFNVSFFECSAKTGMNIDVVFEKMGEEVMEGEDIVGNSGNSTIGFLIRGYFC